MADDHWQVMRNEADGAPGTFMMTLYSEHRWDAALFATLDVAMRAVCADMETSTSFERWLAEGVWYITDWVPAMTSHPAFNRPEDSYYRRAIERLGDIAYWFFRGESIYQPGHVWEPF